ncbi:hypothetical protein [Streptomyces sp. LN245]|uniref:hypothetical protein n=1 Tax=Streptomyces sp. LN245 TaxID=3112975 RepID=UPI00371FB353
MTADTAAWRKSACILCENNCGIQIQTDGRRFTKIRGDKEHVATAGYTCNKALRLDHYQNGGARLPTPLRREPDGSFTPIDWEYRHTRDRRPVEDRARHPRRRIDLLLRRRRPEHPHRPHLARGHRRHPWHKHVPARIQPLPT